MVLGVSEVSARLGREDVVFLDVRDESEFEGTRQMQGNPRLGRIPGARSCEWRRFLEHRAEYPADAGTARDEGYVLERFRAADDLRAELDKVGVSRPDTEVVIYCQKSHRASLVYLAFQELGYTNGQVYVGSFREWSKRMDLPVEA